MVECGLLGPSVLLSTGQTPLELMLLRSWPQLGCALVAKGLDPFILLADRKTTCFEAVLASPGMADVALAMARSPKMDPLWLLGDGQSLFERLLKLGPPPMHPFARQLVYSWIEVGKVLPTTKLQDGRSCLDFALANNAKDVIELMVKKLLST